MYSLQNHGTLYVIICWTTTMLYCDHLARPSPDLKFVGTGGPVKFFLAV